MVRFADPFEDMDRMFGALGGRWRGGGMMPMDAFESDGIWTLRFDLAGANPDEVDITVESGVMTVTADRPLEDTEGVNCSFGNGQQGDTAVRSVSVTGSTPAMSRRTTITAC